MKFPNDSFWKLSGNSSDLNALSYAKKVFEILNQGKSVEMDAQEPNSIELENHEQSFLFKTSGTSGVPKTCVHSWSGLENAYLRLKKYLNISGSYDAISCLPVYHIGGWMQLVRSWFSGGSVIFSFYKDFADAKKKNLFNRRFVSLVPTQLFELLKSDTAISNLRKCKGIFVGGAACDEKLLTKAKQESLPIYLCYGLTETAGMISVLDKEDFARGATGVGRVMPNVSMQLNAEGRICVNCESLALMFEGKQDLSSGWLTTSDIGEVSDGSWKVLYRSDRIINSGGKKVMPELVENEILDFPGVRSCRVFGVADEKWGQKVVAHVVPCSTNFESLKGFLKTRLRDYEIPKDLVGVKEIKSNSINWKKKA